MIGIVVILAGASGVSAGSNPSSLLHDQRGIGYDRIIDMTDCGAFEYGSGPAAGWVLLIN